MADNVFVIPPGRATGDAYGYDRSNQINTGTSANLWETVPGTTIKFVNQGTTNLGVSYYENQGGIVGLVPGTKWDPRTVQKKKPKFISNLTPNAKQLAKRRLFFFW